MALGVKTVWEVRTTGDDSNGGAFDPATNGTDFSQQNGPVVNFGGGQTGTIHTTTTQLNVSGYTVSSADVGNTIQVSAGGTIGFYKITAVDTVNNRWTVDRSLGTSGATINGKMGGALSSLTKLVSSMSGGHCAFVKAGTYSISSTLALVGGGAQYFTVISGYSSTRNDNGMPTIQATSAVDMITSTSSVLIFSNFTIDGANIATNGIILGSTANRGNHIQNVHVKKCKGAAIQFGAGRIRDCKVSEMDAAATHGIVGTGQAEFCHVENINGPGFCPSVNPGNTGGSMFIRCVSKNNATGILLHSPLVRCDINNCVIYGSSGNGISYTTYNSVFTMNNIIVNNGGYGISGPTDFDWVNHDSCLSQSNYFFGNVSGARNGSLGEKNFALASMPFVDPSSNNWNISPSLYGAGVPNSIQLIDHSVDPGIVQHADLGLAFSYSRVVNQV